MISLNYRPDRSLSDDLNLRFRGAVANRQNIGKSNDELIALWNETYPDDPAA